MRAFVAGATGYTGRALVRVLRARGADVIPHVRPDSSRLDAFRREFAALGAYVDATPWEEPALLDAMVRLQPTHVFALLGTTRRRMHADRVSTYERVDYGLTAMLLRAVRSGAHRARFIYLSAMGASETTRNEYMRVRGRIEAELRASGLSWIAARPGFVTGPDREESRPAERIIAVLSDGFLHGFARLGVREPARKYASLTGEELARALASIAEDRADGVYDVAALRAQAER